MRSFVWILPAVILFCTCRNETPQLPEPLKLGTEISALELKAVSCGNDVLVMRNRRHVLRLKAESSVAFIDDIPVALNAPVTLSKDGRWQTDSFSAQYILAPILNDSLPEFRTILLDPGHGGHDTGTISPDGVREKDLNLRLALLLAEKLRKDGYTVHLTRSDDRFLSLDERPAMIEKVKADLFISVHHNSAANTKAEGHETFILRSENSSEAALSSQSAALAFAVEKNLSTLSPSRGVKSARFKVLRLASTPAILIEAGFLSNPDEAARLAAGEFQNAFARLFFSR